MQQLHTSVMLLLHERFKSTPPINEKLEFNEMPTEPTPAQQKASRENGSMGGRPSKPEPCNKKMTIGFTEAELQWVREAVAKTDLSMSEYGRRCVLGRVVVSKSDTEQTRLLMKITGLLKHIHNESGGAYSTKTAAMLSDVHQLILDLKK